MPRRLHNLSPLFVLPLLLGMSALAVACQRQRAAPPPTGAAPPKPLPSPTAFSPQAGPTARAEVRLWVEGPLPAQVGRALQGLEALEGMPVAHALSAEQADIRLGTEGDWPLSETIYAVAMPFPSVVDSVSLAELRQIWEGHHPSLGPLWVPQGEEDVLRALIGPRGDAGLRLAPLEDLLERTWGAPGSLALTPFPALQPRWKVLALGGISPLAGDFDAASYALSYRLGITASPELAGALQEALGLPPSNRDPQRMTSLVLTGVTALTRVTAWKMQVNGVHYPGALIRRWLQEADYAHISHEVSFSPQCPDPNPSRLGTRFCSDPANLELFPYLGVDIVELTGNHLLDYGVEPFLETLALYEEAGMKVYGGGVNLEQARQPLLLEHNGNRLALLGCNSAGPPSVWATAERPGAAPCDMDALAAEIGRLRQQGYLVVVTFQWHEYALTVPPAGQKRGFRRAAEAGAVVVSGSQAHQPQTMEFFGDSFIHYGLGNLFFDQMWLAARREFIDRYVFYDGRLLSVELLTAMLEDFAQPRPMDPQERREFLAQIFRASGW